MASVRNNPKDVSFAELDKVMRRCGFERSQPGSGSSHFTYYHSEFTHLIQTVSYRKRIKAVYVEQCLAKIDELQALQASEED